MNRTIKSTLPFESLPLYTMEREKALFTAILFSIWEEHLELMRSKNEHRAAPRMNRSADLFVQLHLLRFGCSGHESQESPEFLLAVGVLQPQAQLQRL